MRRNIEHDTSRLPSVSRAEEERLTMRLRHSELMRLGSATQRLPACVRYSLTTIPPRLRPLFSSPMAYLIQWLYALDGVLDSCPSLDYAADLSLLLRAAATGPFPHGVELARLRLHHDPHRQLPGLDFSLLTLVETLQPLRQQLRERAASAAGPLGFDRQLDAVVGAMTTEARWRLEASNVGFGEYMAVASVSISGALCLWVLLAMLPAPDALCQAVMPAAGLADIGARLANDLATHQREKAEGSPNAVLILGPQFGSEAQAERRVRQLIEITHTRLRSLTYPLSPEPFTPLDILNYYIYYSLVVARAMYHGMDFGSKGDNQ